MSVLGGVKVVETARWVAGPYCGKFLADQGAEVLKLEPPAGDRARWAGPFPGDDPDPNASGLFLHLNTGKRSSVIDPALPGSIASVRATVANADVVIDDGTLVEWGLKVDDLIAANPKLVVTQVTGFGDVGPYADYRMNDYVAYATSAWMSTMGEPDRAPVYPGLNYAFYVAGVYAAFGTISALLHAVRSGNGQRISVSVLDAAISIDFYESTGYSYGIPIRRRNGQRVSGVAASLQPCADGWIAMFVNPNPQWTTFCEVIGAPGLAQAPFEQPQSRLKNADELERRLRLRLALFPVADLVAECQRRRLAVTPVLEPRDVMASEQLRARDWFAHVTHPTAGSIKLPGGPYSIAGHPVVIDPAPSLGSSTLTIGSGE